jgi:hypothetical protein
MEEMSMKAMLIEARTSAAYVAPLRELFVSDMGNLLLASFWNIPHILESFVSSIGSHGDGSHILALRRDN